MEIRVVYLGGSRGESGTREETLTLAPGASVEDVAKEVARRHPSLAGRLANVRWARNYEFAQLDELLNDGDEVALLPPVAGGSPERVRVQSDPIQLDDVLAQVATASAGALVTFIGTVRNRSRGVDVLALEYESYEPMTSRVLARIVRDVEKDHPEARVAISHRTGRLTVGERSVVIAVASPHRDAAYDACRETLERLKVDAPIWKREISVQGEEWVSWGGG